MDAASLARGGLLEALGIEIRELAPEQVVVTMPITARHLQPFGFLHGGASLALAETAASLGGLLHCLPGHAAFGLEINANHLRPKREGILIATGAPLHLGRTTQVWDVKIADEEGRLVCVSRCTLAVVRLDPAEPAVDPTT
ncbi:MAG: hotdog fold thioesterase [Chloroflexota bacterium]|nr:hotdog fold thioesterase [Chloroflexota bacterium]